MPTRLVVLLHSRKSAAAGSGAIVKAPARSMQPNAAPASTGRNRSQPLRGATMVRPWLIASIPLGEGISREASRTVNENGPKIIDVGMGWPWREKVAQFGEEFGRIVVVKKDGRIEA